MVYSNVWSSDFSGNQTSPFIRNFRLRLQFEELTPGSISWRYQINPVSDNAATPFGTFNWSVTIRGVTRSGSRSINWESIGAQTTVTLDSGSFTTTSTSVSTSGSVTSSSTIRNASGSGSWSTQVSTTPAAPSPPTSVSASTNRTDGILISWSGASGNISSYGIWYGPTPTASSNPDFFVFTTQTFGSYLDTSAPVGSRNYWVRAFGEGGNSAYVPANGVTGTRLSSKPVFSDTTVTANWTVGKNYSTAPDRTVFASNTNSYSLIGTSGTFPNWLSINSNGQLSGTPPSSGTFTFRVSADGPGGTEFSSNISIVVHGAVSWIDETLADGIVGVPYSDSVNAANATSYSIAPAFNLSTSGLSFNAVSATIAGTPKEIKSYTFTIVASNPGDSISKQFTLNFRSGGKRFENGVAQIITNKKRYDAATSTWVDIFNAKRWNAATNEWRNISN